MAGVIPAMIAWCIILAVVGALTGLGIEAWVRGRRIARQHIEIQAPRSDREKEVEQAEREADSLLRQAQESVYEPTRLPDPLRDEFDALKAASERRALKLARRARPKARKGPW